MKLSLYVLVSETLITLTILTSYITLIIIFAMTVGINLSNITDLAENWNYGPIIDVYSNAYGCGSDSSLTNDIWPGTVEGCSFSNLVRRDRCGKTGTQVHEQPAIAYTIWRGTNLCVKRVSATYLDLSIAKDENSCPSGQRSCGKIDTLNNVMCVPTKTNCPFNYLEFIPTNQPSPSGFSFNATALTGATMITSNVNTKGKILNQFSLSEDTPCYDTYYENYIGPLYTLEYFFERSQCVSPDGVNLIERSYETKDAYSYSQVYIENGIYDVLNTLPFYPAYYNNYVQNTNRTMNLFHRNYLGISADCQRRIKESNTGYDIMVSLYSIEDQIGDASTAALVAVIIGSIGMALHIAVNIRCIWLLFKGNYYESDEEKKRTCFLLVCHFLLFSIFIVGCILVAQFTGISNDFGPLLEDGCLGSVELQQKLILTSKLTSRAFPLALITVIGSGISAILMTLHTIIVCFQSSNFSS